MTYTYTQLLLTLSLIITSYAVSKTKRDLSDLKGDKVLQSLFSSDIQEKRKDRSVAIEDEQTTNQRVQQQQQPYPSWNYVYNTNAEKLDERREVNPAQELASDEPFISNSMPVLNSQQIASFQSPQFSQVAAVDPSYIAANFVPLSGASTLETIATESKKSSIPMSAENAAVGNPPAMSYPLQLHVHSPNVGIQGIAPHFEEFGETVSSVKKAMKAEKRFNIPKPDMYDSEIVKKSSIPHPNKSKKKSKVTKPHKKHHKKSPKKTKQSRRQYIPQTQQYLYNNPAFMNSIQSNGLSAARQGPMMQFSQPQPQPEATVASQVQNLDGAITRPVISGEVCSDQYAQCADFAKNDYCINFKPQMEVQCRKSCKFCVPKPAEMTSSVAQQRDGSGDVDSGDGSGSEQIPATKFVKDLTGSKRHDVLQERGIIHHDTSESVESGSGDTDSGSGSGGSGNEDTDTDGKSTFRLPNKKSNVDNSDVEESGESGSGSGSGSGDESIEEPQKKEKVLVKPVKPAKRTKHSKIAKVTHKRAQVKKTKRTRIPRPIIPGAYPRIDLKAIASALAHYEEAALELAGEYPKPQDVDVTEYTRSFIPHPETAEQVRENRNRQNVQIAKIITAERARKSNIPKYLRVTSDAKKPEVLPSDADSLDQVQQRFAVPGVEPTLNDYYAETGKLNPFERRSKNYKKSKIESMRNMMTFDPYEYLRNMPAGASMEPIIDPSKRSEISSDHSYPVFLMKVSPADEKKYVEEPAERRGKIRHYNAEGIEVSAERMKELQREKIAEFEAQALSSVPLSAITQRSSAPKASNPVQPKKNIDTTGARKFQIPPQQQAQQQTQQVIQQQPQQIPQNFMYNAQFQQMQPNRYAAAIIPEQQQPQQQQQQIQPDVNAASLFPNAEPVGFDQQPGESSLKGKMLSAFFDVKPNSSPEEGSGGGSGDNSEVGTRNVVWPGGFK